MRVATILGLSAFFLGSVSSGAFAEDAAPKPPAAKKPTIIEVTVTSHKPVPTSVDVSRTRPRVALAPLVKPAADPSAAIEKDPF